MTQATYLERIFELFRRADARINLALAEADLPPVADWYPGEVIPLRVDNTPYGWFVVGQWPHGERPAPCPPQKDDPSVWFAVPVTVTLAFAAGDAETLNAAVAAYLPRVMAALEGVHEELTVEVVDWQPSQAVNHHFRCDSVRFVVRGCRQAGMAG